MSDKVIICLSGTGNSFHVAKRLAEKIGFYEVLLGPDILDNPSILGNPEEIGIVFPTYCGLPSLNLGPLLFNVLSNPSFDKLKFFFAITTCGFLPGHSLKVAEQMAMDVNILTSYMDYVRMPDTYVPLKPIPDQQTINSILSSADTKIDSIAEEIRRNDFKIPRRKMFTKLAMNRYVKLCRNPGTPIVHVGPQCTGCGHCEAVCPRDAITMKDGHPQFSENCENCLACYHFCPSHAIELGKPQKGTSTYYSEDITGYHPDYR